MPNPEKQSLILTVNHPAKKQKKTYAAPKPYFYPKILAQSI